MKLYMKLYREDSKTSFITAPVLETEKYRMLYCLILYTRIFIFHTQYVTYRDLICFKIKAIFKDFNQVILNASSNTIGAFVKIETQLSTLY